MHLNNRPELKTFRRKLRNNLTPAEARLWTMLKGSKLQGRKFRRQHSFAGYILDFYCPAEKFGIELDGESHNSEIAEQHDYERKMFLDFFGVKVLRFENKLVFDNPEFVLDRIKSNFGWREGLDEPEWVDW